MSTEQAGVSDPASDEAAEGARRAPRSSRRAIRQAERAAEREAILTGQQPLLTRREMRRLREEAKALQAAVEAGEITPEQARALQDPLAEQPVIEPQPQDTERQGAVRRENRESPVAGGTGEREPAPARPQPSYVNDWRGGEAVADRLGQSGRPPSTVPGSDDSATDSARDSATLGSQDPVVGVPSEEVRAASASPGGTGSAPSVPAVDVLSTGSGQEQSSEGGSPTWRSLTADEAVALSELPTGLMDAVDLPIAADEPWPAPQQDGQPAPVPTRSSLRERLETGQAPTVTGAGTARQAGQSSSGGGFGLVDAEGTGADSASWDERDASQAGFSRFQGYQDPQESAPQDPGGRPLPVEDRSRAVSGGEAVRTSSPAYWGSSPEPAVEAETQQSSLTALSNEVHRGLQERSSVSTAAPGGSGGSVRRPIVRIPAAAQGVRTVNASTGELSAVQPVDLGDAAVVREPLGEGPVRQEAAFGDETSVISTDFEEEGAPHWPSLRDDPSAAGATQPASPYSFPDQPVAAPPGPPSAGALPAHEPSDVPPLPRRSSAPLGEPPVGEASRTGRLLLVVLIVVVVALVIAAAAWFLLTQMRSDSSAAGLVVLQDAGAQAHTLARWLL